MVSKQSHLKLTHIFLRLLLEQHNPGRQTTYETHHRKGNGPRLSRSPACQAGNVFDVSADKSSTLQYQPFINEIRMAAHTPAFLS